MPKIISYKFLSAEINHGTEDAPDIEHVLLRKTIECKTQAIYNINYPLAENEAVPGTMSVSGEFDIVVAAAPHSLIAGEYITINGVLYKAIVNIPAGEPIIVGQNVEATTYEEQLYELTKGE